MAGPSAAAKDVMVEEGPREDFPPDLAMDWRAAAKIRAVLELGPACALALAPQWAQQRARTLRL
jgi:hypothetical protein